MKRKPSIPIDSSKKTSDSIFWHGMHVTCACPQKDVSYLWDQVIGYCRLISGGFDQGLRRKTSTETGFSPSVTGSSWRCLTDYEPSCKTRFCMTYRPSSFRTLTEQRPHFSFRRSRDSLFPNAKRPVTSFQSSSSTCACRGVLVLPCRRD